MAIDWIGGMVMGRPSDYPPVECGMGWYTDKGWICPRCDRVNSPNLRYCDCPSDGQAVGTYLTTFPGVKAGQFVGQPPEAAAEAVDDSDQEPR